MCSTGSFCLCRTKEPRGKGKGTLVVCFFQNCTTLIYTCNTVLQKVRMHRYTPQGSEARLQGSFHADLFNVLPGDLDDLFEAAEVRGDG